MEIKPFKAYRFNPVIVGDVGKCISPPYDVINEQQQQQLYDKSDYNIVRIIKGKIFESDNGSENQYTRAAKYLNDWITKGALKEDDEDTIYIYIQQFEIAGVIYQRYSFIALAKLEDFGKVVKPHEQILQKPIVDRLNLKRATKAKFGLVFMVYEDKENIADKIIEKNKNGRPLIEFVDEQDVRHQLFALTDKQQIDTIVNMMKDKSVIIADGHHRYTTGLTYMKENIDNPQAHYQMLAFSNMCHEGLVVLATHRLVANLDNFDFSELIDHLNEDFEVTGFDFESGQSKTEAKMQLLREMKAQYNNGNAAFGLYGGDNTFYLAVLKNPGAMKAMVPEKSKPWRSLDVSILHKLILEKLLGIDDEKLTQGGYLQYVKDTPNAIDDSIAMVDQGDKQAAFLMNPPRLEQMRMVADHGERMPQKSTYFFPKIFTGLTINKL